jgi:hypothetical protein
MIQWHKVCPYCGFYKSKEVVSTAKKSKKKAAKAKKKEKPKN